MSKEMTDRLKEYSGQAQSLSKTENNHNLGVIELSYREMEKLLNTDPQGIAKNYGVPTNEFILNASRLAKGKPEKAASLVFIPKFETNQDGPLTRRLGPHRVRERLEMLTTAAKLVTAKENLILSQEKKNEYNGLIENILGLNAVAEEEKMDRRKFLALAGLTGLGTVLGACMPKDGSSVAATKIFSEPTRSAETAPLPTQKPTEEPTPTAIPEIRIETDPSVEIDKLPVVTYEDFVTGKVIEAERKYLETHNPFNGNEIWPTKFIVNVLHISAAKQIWIYKTKEPFSETYYKDPYFLPTRNLFFFRIVFPLDFFPKEDKDHLFYDFSNQQNLMLIGQVWLNPDSKSDDPADKYRILNYPFDNRSSAPMPGSIENNKVSVPLPVYSFGSENKSLTYGPQLIRSLILKFYKDDVPTKYLREWAATGRIPAELERFLLASGYQNFSKMY